MKNPDCHADTATIYYHDIGDYLSQKEKFEKIKSFGSVENPDMKWETIHPNEAGDWINQRNPVFASYTRWEKRKERNQINQSLYHGIQMVSRPTVMRGAIILQKQNCRRISSSRLHSITPRLRLSQRPKSAGQVSGLKISLPMTPQNSAGHPSPWEISGDRRHIRSRKILSEQLYIAHSSSSLSISIER